MVSAEEERFEAMYRAQYPAVRAYASALTSSLELDDVVADTFAVAWRKRDDLPAEWVRGWLLGTVRNVIRNGHRRKRRVDRFVARLGWLQPGETTLDMTGAAELAVVRTALGSLSDSDQEVLVLAGWFELSSEELGVALDVSSNTAAVRLHRARARLRDAVETTGGELAC